MNLALNLSIILNMILHIAFLVLEMFLWTKPFGLKTFRMTPAQAEATKVLAMNQGLYNGFLAAGLLWGLISGNPQVKLFFLLCILVAGIYGGFTASRSIFFLQALPALIALILLKASGSL